MPKFTLFTLLMLTTPAVFAHKDRIESLRTLAVGFKTGETVTFAFSGSRIAAVTLRVGTTDYPVPPSECAKLRDVRFETVSFLWNGSHASATEANYFYLQFDMGAESTRDFGGLPQVRLMFRGGKFLESTVIKKIGKDTSQYSKL